jgi:hypothetical protein
MPRNYDNTLHRVPKDIVRRAMPLQLPFFAQQTRNDFGPVGFQSAASPRIVRPYGRMQLSRQAAEFVLCAGTLATFRREIATGHA